MEIDRNVLLAAFFLETDEKVALMETAILALEASPGSPVSTAPEAHDGRPELRDIFRVAHTIKGNAASLELSALTRFSHRVEDLLERLCDGRMVPTANIVRLLLRVVDVLRTLVDDARSAADPHRMPPQGAALLREIRSLLDDEPRRPETVPPMPFAPASTAPAPTAPAPTALAPTAPKAKARARSTLRVDVAKLDRILDLSGEIAILNRRVAQKVAGADLETDEALYAEARLLAELQEHVLLARMLPTRSLFAPFVRTVRDLADACGKRARLLFDGGDVDVDMAVLAELRDPLMHMIRNAIDHGIERPEVRAARGKDPCGTISLSARREGQSFAIAISDDGHGLDRARILARARQAAPGAPAIPTASIAPATAPSAASVPSAASPSDRELCQLVLEPGFSTAANVTNRSGRGMGLDIVRQTVSALRGSLTLDSPEGAGVTITLRLPLTVAILRGFGVRVGAQAFVLPMDAVVACLELPCPEKPAQNAAEDAARGASGVVRIHESGHERVLPFLRLRALFDLPPRAEEDEDERESLVVVEQNGVRAGIAVDALRGESQAVLKPLGPLFGDGVVSGSTILEDGGVALVLDVPAILARCAVETTGAPR
ncbi:chemotaxis protein CheA [Pendulispora albinea]|uniref:Chemotaxis protein CheA n=1 Tax=Pendulispora albinea TaxID=2741071 RepID=A0ABZ2LQC2_9BACT